MYLMQKYLSPIIVVLNLLHLIKSEPKLPQILTDNGNIQIVSYNDGNISFITAGDGYLNFNNHNINLPKKTAHSNNAFVSDLQNDLVVIKSIIDGTQGLDKRMESLEMKNNLILKNSSRDRLVNKRVFNLRLRIARIEDKLKILFQGLIGDNCSNKPCKNGGRCQDLINGYICFCTENWEGPTCEIDANECSRLAGTDLGCQNGATCINKLGSYECLCPKGYFGLHCTRKNASCDLVPARELCGNGICVSQSNPPGYKCICEQGWTTNGSNPACNIDVNECVVGRYPCSINPLVSCSNTPGGFQCDVCPTGFSGNGFHCVDINECLENNGGCSKLPFVPCINVPGSRRCGLCPPGYVGDGITCQQKSSCSINNGGCHPLAICSSPPRISRVLQSVQCQCPENLHGNGFGPNGCILVEAKLLCMSNPCGTGGRCITIPESPGYKCECEPFFSGSQCEQYNRCSAMKNPCKNGGTCINTKSKYLCKCIEPFIGANCENQRELCGGDLNGPKGVLKYPGSNSSVELSEINCAWTLAVAELKNMNISFNQFHLRKSSSCTSDWLKIFDGASSNEMLIGKFCGDQQPKGGSIITTSNYAYLQLHSDRGHKNGKALNFNLTWTEIDSKCNSVESNKIQGEIKSPKYPEDYPNNKDCYWKILAPPGKRIQLRFHSLNIGINPNCSFDYLEIFNGFSERHRLIHRYCNTSYPEFPIIIPGSDTLIHFHSDNSNAYSGFHITYTIVDGIAGCGGIFTTSTGEISLPTANNEYIPNLRCEYLISQPEELRVRLTFLLFDLELSNACAFDYLEIRDGVERTSFHDSGKLVGRYCGKSVPSVWISSTNLVNILFESDWTYYGKGFRIKYEAICGNVFDDSKGIITSPGYPDKYPESQNCVYEIQAQAGFVIKLSFINFNVGNATLVDQCLTDFLEIRDGESENSALIGRYCGSKEMAPASVTSTHNHLYLKFNSRLPGKGFLLNYSTIDVGCGGILRKSIGVIQSPREADFYPINSVCKWMIIAPSGSVIQLTWITFSLEKNFNCTADYVVVYDGASVSGSDGFVGRFCGLKLPPTIISSGNVLSIQFRSDHSKSSYGFVANYLMRNESNICGRAVYAPSGVIRSPGYPIGYPSNQNCVWTIHVAVGQQILLNFTYFSLQGTSKKCRNDFLEIRNGAYGNSPLIDKFCGGEIPPVIMSFTNQLYLNFRSGSFKSGRGFEVFWETAATGCGGTLASSTGHITSPHYPEPYGRNAECYWRIVTSAGSYIQVVIYDIDLETNINCHYDYVEFHNGVAVTNNPIGRYCDENHPPSIKTSRNQLFIKFRSDSDHQGRGFNLKYSTICNNTISGFHGAIESPNYPNPYPNNLDCIWTITVPRGNKINVTFAYFDLEKAPVRLRKFNGTGCQYDFVDIKSPIEESGEMKSIGTYCNGKPPPGFTSTFDTLAIHFHTDRSKQSNGFRLEWVIHGCGGKLTHPIGSFSTPDYPKGYPSNTVCEWLINIDFMSSIQLTLSGLNIEHSTDCSLDGLEVFNGPDANSPRMLQVCSSLKKSTIVTSSGNFMFVRFYSDWSYEGRGFEAFYTSVSTKCGGLFTNPKGHIHSRNYPKNYENNDECFWLIKMPESYLVELTFVDFEFEKNQKKCSNDFVRIFDGPTTEAPVLLTYCGSGVPIPIVSTTNELLVQMQTDILTNDKGFDAYYAIACGRHIKTESFGIISSNEFVRSANIDFCSWTIEASNPGDHVSLTFTHLDFSYDANDFDIAIIIYEGFNTAAPIVANITERKLLPTLVSHGQVFHLVVQRNSDIDYSITYSVLNTACGGSLTSMEGEFASLGYPENYPQNADCTWTIDPAAGNQVSLRFLKIDIESSPNCNTDFVEVREGGPDGPLLQVLCEKRTLLNDLKAASLWVHFKSDEESTAQGFLAYYSVFGTDVNGTEGRIKSPFYPKSLTTHSEYSWTITVSEVKLIQIQLLDIDVQIINGACFENGLIIYDGVNSDAPSLFSCSNRFSKSVTSTSNTVYITFFSSGSNSIRKFDLEWKAIDSKNENITMVGRMGDYRCALVKLSNLATHGNELTAIELRSPGFPRGYGANMRCEWTFTTNLVDHINIKFVAMNLEKSPNCETDYVQIYSSFNSPTEDRQNLGKFCHSNATKLAPIQAGNLLTLQFVTDQLNNGTGFQVHIYDECGGEFYLRNGIIDITQAKLKSYFDIYNSNVSRMNCTWKIKVRQGRKISFNFKDFNIENSKLCRAFVVIKNGSNSDWNEEIKYCNFKKESEMIPISKTNEALVQFSIDRRYMNDLINFTLVYSEVAIACGDQIELTPWYQEVNISSPNYPEVPDPHVECEWLIRAPVAEALVVHFVERFDLTISKNCYQSGVELYDGASTLAPMIAKLCGDDDLDAFKTTANLLLVRYFNYISQPKNGFKAQISIAKCGGTIHAEKGMITSPNFFMSGSLIANLKCTWIITGLQNHGLDIKFQSLNLPKNTNCSSVAHVEIQEMLPPTNDSENNWNQLGVYCGSSNVEGALSAFGNKIKVIFDTMDKTWDKYKGFSLEYISNQDECGETLSGPEGIFTSPGYPMVKIRHSICKWEITGPEGRRIKLEFIDFDFPEETIFQITIFDGKKHKNKIAMTINSVQNRIVKSSSNSLFMYYWVSSPGGRGFKAKWTTDEPTICQGQMSGPEGSISTPIIPESESNKKYFCSWVYRAKPFQTLALTIHPVVINMRNISSCNYVYSRIQITEEKEKEIVATFCTVVKDPIIVRSPFTNTRLNVLKSYYPLTSLNATIDYKINSCGGILENGGTITSPNFPNGVNTATDCAWLIRLADNLQAKITFSDFDLNESCTEEFVSIRNGRHGNSPLVGIYCGKSLPPSFQASRNYLWLEYHSSGGNWSTKGFKLLIDEVQFGCGGFYEQNEMTITSPGYPKSYSSNTECLWVVHILPNYHISLKFNDIFQIEESDNCTKDYVEVWDKVDNQWTSLGRSCGRNSRVFNTTFNWMKILFKSDGKTNGHGFKAHWSAMCGGTFYATENINLISSPGYPVQYSSNLICNYTIMAGPFFKSVVVNFTDFDVESGTVNCNFDMVSIFYRKRNSFEDEFLGSYCNNHLPPTEIRSFQNVTISFKSDRWMNHQGFVLSYTIDKCGGNINTSTLISSPNEMNDNKYMIDSDCVWNITSPDGKSIVLRFKEFDLEFSRSCQYDYVAIYDSVFMDEDSRLALLCGNLTSRPPVIRSSGNNMIVHFKTDHFSNFQGFKSLVLFTPGPLLGCGGEISLTSKSPKFNLKMPLNGTNYEPLLDCHWLVNGPKDSYISISVDSFHVTPCTDFNTTDANLKCQCDFLEIYDGPGPLNEPILRHCGHTIPKSIVSTSNQIWVRFASDDSVPKSTGFVVKFESKPSLCGESHLIVTKELQTLTSPHFPSNYPPNLRCKWILKISGNESVNQLNLIDIYVETIHLEDADSNGRCINDRLEISEKYSLKYMISESFGSDLIWGGSRAVNSFLGSRIPSTVHTYCGLGKPFDYYSGSDTIVVSFTTNEKNQAPGFKINYQMIGCNRNYTGVQGRILIRNSSDDCLITIRAPENSTISLYFQAFIFFDTDGCRSSGLRVYDGPTKQAPIMGTYCGFLNPNPIFSSSNSLVLNSWNNRKNGFDIFDLTYTTTDQGQGCGGLLYNYGGRFTSPFHPNSYRKEAKCKWHVSTPAHTKLNFEFIAFNIGSDGTCDTDYIEIFQPSLSTDTSTLKYRFCGNEKPSDISMDDNMALVIYTTSKKNDGQGWDIKFFAKGF